MILTQCSGMVPGLGLAQSRGLRYNEGGLLSAEEEIGTLLRARGWTLATAESATGGLVGHRVTNVAGSSDYFVGGMVAYSNDAKMALLDVRLETLIAVGAVSDEVAREMARGARRRLNADVAVSITGIAGPGGGTDFKPVGLTYIALSAPDAEVCRRYVFEGNRLENKEMSASAALRLVWEYLKGTHMVEFVNEPVMVEAQPRPDQPPRPLAFVWRGMRYAVASWGREGAETHDGETFYCYLVQTEGAETWQLCRHEADGTWMVRRRWPRGPQAV